MQGGSYYVPLKELENGLVVPWKFTVCIHQECGNRTNNERKDNAHKRTLTVHGYRNN